MNCISSYCNIIRTLLLAFLLLAGGSVFAQFGGGSGTSADPYIIRTSAHLAELATGSTSSSYENVYFKISDDFSGGTLSTPIGTNANPFKGNFDGNGKMIDITREVSVEKNGLFGNIGAGANIHNIVVKGKISVVTSTMNYIGGIVGYAESDDGTRIKITDCCSYVEITGNKAARSGGIAGSVKYVDITNCHNKGSSNSYQFIGGIVGMVYYSSIINCTNSGNLSASNSPSNIGGICGSASVDATKAQSFVSGCTNSGTISGAGSVGGILGYSSGQNKALVEVSNCTNKGAVTGTSGSIGGIIGNDNGYTNVSNCNNTASVSGTNKVGGIIGYAKNISIVEDCSNSGNIVGTSSSGYVSGIVAHSYGTSSEKNTIFHCTNSGTISGASQYVGGIVGHASYNNIDQCSNIGNVETSCYSIGGIVGYLNQSTLRNSYNRGLVTKTKSTNGSSGNGIGGVVGDISSSSVENCYNTGIVSAVEISSFCVGGVVGRIYNGSVGNCYNGGTINLNASNTGYSGNIVGFNGGSATVQYCYYRTGMGAGSRIQGTEGTATTSYIKSFVHTSESDATCTLATALNGDYDLVDALNYWRTNVSGEAASYLEWFDDAEASRWNNLGMPEFFDDTHFLPIELLSFTASCNGRSSLVEWTTATEKNNDFFVLERSTDAVNFKEIARIAGAGNSIEPINYVYTDYGVRNGDNYYRLVQVDYDGTSTASEIIVTNCFGTDGEPDVLAFPNPFDDNLTLHFENFGNIQATVEVYDMLGRMVHTQKVNCSQNDYEVVLRLAGLSDGTYNVRISTKEFVINKKVVKN